jgi:hypothetical protein
MYTHTHSNGRAHVTGTVPELHVHLLKVEGPVRHSCMREWGDTHWQHIPVFGDGVL